MFIFKVARQPLLLFVGIVWTFSNIYIIRDSFQFISNAPTILLNDILHRIAQNYFSSVIFFFFTKKMRKTCIWARNKLKQTVPEAFGKWDESQVAWQLSLEAGVRWSEKCTGAQSVAKARLKRNARVLSTLGASYISWQEPLVSSTSLAWQLPSSIMTPVSYSIFVTYSYLYAWCLTHVPENNYILGR